jgi:hypothetical protein
MTRKHYILIASSLLSTRPPKRQHVRYTQWHTTVNDLALDLRLNNNNFDRQRFLEACGLE